MILAIIYRKIEISFTVVCNFKWKLEFVSNVLSMIADRCAKSCNTINDLFSWAYFPNQTEDLNSQAFNIVIRIKNQEN